MLVGVHLGRQGNVADLPKIDCIQIFLRGPLGRGKAYATEEEQRAARKDHSVYNTVVVHSPYTINMARKQAGHFLKEQVRLSHLIGAHAFVVHVGHAIDMSVQEACDALRTSIEYVLHKVPDIQIWIETPAGSGREFCTHPQEMIKLLSSFRSLHRVGLCLDTAHVFVAGHDPMTYIGIIQKSKLGIGILKGIHLNGSVHDKGSGKDQHAPLGEGKLSVDKLFEVCDLANSLGIPVILETPSLNHSREIKLLYTRFR